ncbi:MAG: prolyl oligopeptidase family serine peptidase [Dinghuibacter sp.]|nr:prolyl oligopeptidase family serine peptidase [Dinghuibacter sp.]
MRTDFRLFATICCLLLLQVTRAQWNYPHTPRTDSADTWFGVRYADPYRWLENMKDAAVLHWFKQQANFTQNLLTTIPGRNALIREWQQYDKLTPPAYSAVQLRNGLLFYLKQNATDAVAKVYYRKGMNGKETLLFNPGTHERGKSYTVTNILPSPDGTKLGITYTEKGREISTVRILDVLTKTFLPGKVYPSWEGILSWTPDSRAFTYLLLKTDDITNPNIGLGNQSRLHRLSSNYNNDPDIFSIESYADKILPGEIPLAKVVETSPHYVFCEVAGAFGSNLKYYYAPLTELNNATINWKTLCKPEDKLVKSLVITGDSVLAITNAGAPNNKLVMCRLPNTNWQQAETLVPENKKLLENVVHCKDYLLLVYSDGINNELYQYHLATRRLQQVKTPFTGVLGLVWLNRSLNDCIIGITSWNRPYTEFIYHAENGQFEKSPLSQTPSYPAAFNNIVVEEVEVKGHDGVMIPLSILYKRGLNKDGNNICFMESYGAYGISTTPNFSYMVNALALKNVVFAFPHVRGGGEKGEAWHLAGYKTTKPNTWKDFNSCAEYLVQHKFTRPEKLAGKGRSAGGILISRAITENPSLFAAAICDVGIGNAMRNEFTPNGPTNIGELGTVADSTECRALYEMDGMQHVLPGTAYPAVLCVAGWNDPRVIAWQPAKFAAALQQEGKPGKPALLQVNYSGGHSAESKNDLFADLANQYSFALWQCGHPLFQPVKNKRLK